MWVIPLLYFWVLGMLCLARVILEWPIHKKENQNELDLKDANDKLE